MKQVFPKEFLEYTADVHRFRHRKHSLVIYSVILFLLLGILVMLPVVKIPLYVAVPGIIKPGKERVQIPIIRSGQITYSALAANKPVRQGDTLLRLNQGNLRFRRELLTSGIEDYRVLIKDINSLLQNDEIPSHQLASQSYKQAVHHYRQALKSYQLKLNNAKKTVDRSSLLLQRGVIAKAEFEKDRLDYRVLFADYLQFKKEQQHAWRKDLEQRNRDYHQSLLELADVEEAMAQHTVLAPVTGSLINVTPLEVGNYIDAPSVLAEISPDGSLVAECYVPPNKIGLIDEQTAVTFHIDAFNHNQWGQASGELLDISRDVVFTKNQPIFTIRCSIRDTFLVLENGRKGYLRKGLTLSAQFKLAERSLLDLLYDQWHDWLDPGNIR